MFEHDRSAARVEMTTPGLYLFKHDGKLGNAPAHRLFERIKIARATEGPARDCSDYNVIVDDAELPHGVELESLSI